MTTSPLFTVPFSITVTVKKEGWGGGGTRSLTFSTGDVDFAVLKPAGKTLNVSIARGLPKDTSKSVRAEPLYSQVYNVLNVLAMWGSPSLVYSIS